MCFSTVRQTGLCAYAPLCMSPGQDAAGGQDSWRAQPLCVRRAPALPAGENANPSKLSSTLPWVCLAGMQAAHTTDTTTGHRSLVAQSAEVRRWPVLLLPVHFGVCHHGVMRGWARRRSWVGASHALAACSACTHAPLLKAARAGCPAGAPPAQPRSNNPRLPAPPPGAGLPGEVAITKQALSLGYAFMTINSLDRRPVTNSDETARCFRQAHGAFPGGILAGSSRLQLERCSKPPRNSRGWQSPPLDFPLVSCPPRRGMARCTPRAGVCSRPFTPTAACRCACPARDSQRLHPAAYSPLPAATMPTITALQRPSAPCARSWALT